MDLLTILQTVVRRWYITVPVLVVTLVAAILVELNVPAQHEATGSVLLEEPEFDPSRLPASTANANVLITRLEEPDTLADVASGGAELVSRALDTQTIELTATAGAESAAETTVENALAYLQKDVEEVQEVEGVPESERLSGVMLTPSVDAEQSGDAFEASGTLFLRDPSSDITNPYDAGGATSQVLQAVLLSDRGQAEVARRTGPDVEFLLTSSDEAGQIINVSLLGPDPTALLDGFDAVAAALDEELDARQARADVPGSRRIVVVPLAEPRTVEDVSPPLSRAVAAIVGVGGLLALGLAIAVDSFLSRRPGWSGWRRRRSATPDEQLSAAFVAARREHDFAGDEDSSTNRGAARQPDGASAGDFARRGDQ